METTEVHKLSAYNIYVFDTQSREPGLDFGFDQQFPNLSYELQYYAIWFSRSCKRLSDDNRLSRHMIVFKLVF